ncbi:hypothetical protein [Riemerella anatipestifer]|uniref:Uncharacterized protein n=1 Tax=Riemerella anatipestifer TaxID=34085 RepID=A0AAP6HHW2_RIEAN|nr:hypothetical protein [Riemerella anatipestifer]MBT0549102.1 hypothetical protein [Riemerella anatipestifer]MBT0556099.1 hypothetical protein [Riemerella anatipestifer]MBT0559865.1 hypothetical protein [Riemerella anatipestifer]MCD5969075.1 hypothetical protein [Riemerella anatipestifer]MCO7354468.1 hypothetical protein [Riemerella anatipestifer]
MTKLFKIISINTSLISSLMFSQNNGVLITEMSSGITEPNASAQLHLHSDNKGFLYPRVPLNSDTDATTVNTPQNGVTVFNSRENRINFWYDGRWYINYLLEDAKNIIPSTLNKTALSTNTTIVGTFPSAPEEFHFGDSTSGWTPTNVNTNFNITNTTNSTYFIVEGMTSINNTFAATNFGFAVAVFIDGKLVTVRKFFEPASGRCSWKKFNLSGILKDQSVGAHTMEVYVRNLQRSSSNYTQIAYGGASTGCTNVNQVSGKIYLTTQISEIRQ